MSKPIKHSLGGSQCPKCGTKFTGPSIGTHAGKCGVTETMLFWSKVNIGSPAVCWEWIGAKNDDGYGHFRNSEKRTLNAHKYAFQRINGLVPAGMELMHSCDNRACVNPWHMRLGTHQENMLDCAAKGRSWRGGNKISGPAFKHLRQKEAA